MQPRESTVALVKLFVGFCGVTCSDEEVRMFLATPEGAALGVKALEAAVALARAIEKDGFN